MIPAALLVLSTALPTAPQESQTGEIVSDEVVVTLRDDTELFAERTSIPVPNVRGRDDLAEVRVEYHRFFCEDPESTAPPIFLLRGGPGFEGLRGEVGRKGFYEDSIQRFARIADVVVIGQRGIGSSTPNTRCGGYEREPLHQIVTDDEFAERVAAACRDCRATWEAKGYDLSGFNVVEAAADVIEVADWIEADTFTIVGSSFGSHWGMTIMRRYPDRVARAVLGGLEGPDHTYDMPSWVLNSLKRIAAAAEADERIAPLVPEGGLIAAFERTANRLDESPEVVKLGSFEVLMDGRRLRQCALGTTSRTSSRGGMRTWPGDIIRIARGDLTDAAQVAMRRNMGAGLPTASYFSLDCGSGISPERLEILRNDPAQSFVGRGEAIYQAACPEWDGDLGDDFRTNFETEVPTVLVHGTWDTSTPFDNALELAPYFLNSRFVVVEGGSHGAIGDASRASAPFEAALMAFLATGDMEDLPERVELPPVEWTVPKELPGEPGAASGGR